MGTNESLRALEGSLIPGGSIAANTHLTLILQEHGDKATSELLKLQSEDERYSDHVRGNEVAFAAVALGACVIEKHFTLDRNLPGPDHQASIEPTELKALVRGIRTVESALGDGCKRPALSEANSARAARKSLVVTQDVPAGTVLTDDLIAIKRPGTGLPPSMLPFLIGRRTRRDIKKDALLRLEDLM